jgi:hypothetical protein
MAIWQVDFHLIHTAGDLPDTKNDGWLPPLLAGEQVRRAQEVLRDYLGQPWQMVEDWFVFGPENGSRVDVVFETPNTASIVVRFDARSDNEQFPTLMCRLADSLDCVFFSPDIGTIIAANGAELMAAIDAAHHASVMHGLKIK